MEFGQAEACLARDWVGWRGWSADNKSGLASDRGRSEMRGKAILGRRDGLVLF